MNKILEDYFIKTYPSMFVEMYGDPKKTCMAYGISTGDGWVLLLDGLCSKIQWRIKHYNTISPVIFKQIKEKFGTLTIYYDGGDDIIAGMVEFAENMSCYICEKCGKMDNTILKNSKGWIKTACPVCMEEDKIKVSHSVLNNELLEALEKVKNEKQ